QLAWLDSRDRIARIRLAVAREVDRGLGREADGLRPERAVDAARYGGGHGDEEAGAGRRGRRVRNGQRSAEEAARRRTVEAGPGVGGCSRTDAGRLPNAARELDDRLAEVRRDGRERHRV